MIGNLKPWPQPASSVWEEDWQSQTLATASQQRLEGGGSKNFGDFAMTETKRFR